MRVDEAKLQAHILEKHAKSQAAREIKEKQALAGEAKGPPCVPCDMEVCGDAAPVAPAAPAASTGSAARREADRLSAFTAPWRIELFDLSDGNLCGTFVREALATEGRPSYKSDSGRRIRWKRFKSLKSGCWQMLSAKGRLDAFSETDALTPVEDLQWKNKDKQVLSSLHCYVAPAQRLRYQATANADAASGLYQLCRHRGNWRPVYRKVVDAEFQDEEETKAADLFELSYVPPSRKGRKHAGRWEIRAPGAESPLESIAGDAVLPQDLGNSFAVVDTRTRDPQRLTHQPLAQLVSDIVDDFEQDQQDQPSQGGVDNIQDMRAITSVIRWWHVSRFNWVVAVRDVNGCSQLLREPSQIDLDSAMLTDCHCDFCGRQRHLFCLRAFRKIGACPTRCERCAAMGISEALDQTAVDQRQMMHEIFWSCQNCVKYLFGEKAARLKEKAHAKKRVSRGGDAKELMANTAGEEDVRALRKHRAVLQLDARKKDAAPEPSQDKVPESDEEEEDRDAPSCDCGMPAVRKTVANSGPNAGKEYYRCCIFPEAEHCDFFVWAGTPGAPRCRCLQPQAAIQLEVKKEGPTKGKRFFKCPKPRDQQCNFFQWLDQVPGQMAGQAATGRLCMCGQTAMKHQVMKEGPNKGRYFLKCPSGSCLRFFEWLDEPPRSWPKRPNPSWTRRASR